MCIRFLKMIHNKCRNVVYPHSSIERFKVKDHQISWEVKYPEYKPINYTSEFILNEPWADPKIEDPCFEPNWNSLDGAVNRRSYMGDYVINEHGYPLNPVGRTGIAGRGDLGRWGPNHAADPIVTRWKRNNENMLVKDETTNKPILQFVAIQRKDCNEWALPGGMVDIGEKVSATLKREFMEEAMNLLGRSFSTRREVEESINLNFTNGIDIFKGYVDDPRNTDNAWIETVAQNFHDADNNTFGQLPLAAGDDACNVKWMNADSKICLYASHSLFIEKTVQIHDAHW
ncbi:PREDICTED: ADP-ribose pyrophosphatase, mitochondrial [Polistes dominula]|uniref:ADP-ribose pyrophosphatase, mitochondrial n=1 Tax=Polistes dominula TaxID=743375 RepID=A0ABM1HSY5_POLDO|nr:PREDICTED: ADP-ribose pyrophosphatase, mitochondrial [Polistes dominula]